MVETAEEEIVAVVAAIDDDGTAEVAEVEAEQAPINPVVRSRPRTTKETRDRTTRHGTRIAVKAPTLGSRGCRRRLA